MYIKGVCMYICLCLYTDVHTFDECTHYTCLGLYDHKPGHAMGSTHLPLDKTCPSEQKHPSAQPSLHADVTLFVHVCMHNDPHCW